MEGKNRNVKTKTRYGCGCLSWLIIIALFCLPEVILYYSYNWQMEKALAQHALLNASVEETLKEVTNEAKDLNILDIQKSNEKNVATFTFFNQSVTDDSISQQTFAYQLDAHRVASGIYKIYNPPHTYSIGFKWAKWAHAHFIQPQIPNYSYLLITPYTLEMCKKENECTIIREVDDYIDGKNGEDTFLF